MDVSAQQEQELEQSRRQQEELGQRVEEAEGESYICPWCGGVVSLARRRQHELHWCPAHKRPRSDSGNALLAQPGDVKHLRSGG